MVEPAPEWSLKSPDVEAAPVAESESTRRRSSTRCGIGSYRCRGAGIGTRTARGRSVGSRTLKRPLWKCTAARPDRAHASALAALALHARATDTVDWRRGNYTVLARGGRVDSPAGSGELKKQIQMVAEGSVVYAETAPRGSAADVAPDGFAHPVFRAGFAVAIPLPEVS